MDILETYIKMCDCEEIQNQSPMTAVLQVELIKIFARDKPRVFIAADVYTNLDRVKPTWLPRQDQLQEMVGYTHPFDLVHRLSAFVLWYPVAISSMEQLWLAFVMRELHNKQWSGTEWLVI